MNYGIQLYSVRTAMAADFDGTLRRVAKIGYESIEPAGFFGRSVSDVKRILDETGLRISGTHSGWGELRDAYAETLAFHKGIGNPNYIIPGADLKTPEKLKNFIDFVNDVQPRLADEGIALGYHNHSHEFEVTPYGYRIHDVLAEKTNLEFEIDTYWAYKAGEDPVALLRKYRDRERVLHLKDGFADGRGMALGEGTAPIAAVVAAAKELGLYCVVESETQVPDGPSEITRCAEWLKANG